MSKSCTLHSGVMSVIVAREMLRSSLSKLKLYFYHIDIWRQVQIQRIYACIEYKQPSKAHFLFSDTLLTVLV